VEGLPVPTRLVLNGVKSGHCPHMYPSMPIVSDIQCPGFAIPIAVVIPKVIVAFMRQRGNPGTLQMWAASAWPWYHVGYIIDIYEATA